MSNVNLLSSVQVGFDARDRGNCISRRNVKRSPRERCGIEAIAEAEEIRGTSWTRRESFAASAERKFAPSETQSRRARFCVVPSIEEAANEPLNEPTISA